MFDLYNYLDNRLDNIKASLKKKSIPTCSIKSRFEELNELLTFLSKKNANINPVIFQKIGYIETCLKNRSYYLKRGV